MDPGRLDEVKSQPVTGLAVRLAGKRDEAAAAAKAHLRHAVIATLAAVALLAVAIGLTWFAPGSRRQHPAGCAFSSTAK